MVELAIVLTIELSLFKQDQINLAHLLSKSITIGTDELIDDKRLQCVVFGIFQSRQIDFRHAVKTVHGNMGTGKKGTGKKGTEKRAQEKWAQEKRAQVKN